MPREEKIRKIGIIDINDPSLADIDPDHPVVEQIVNDSINQPRSSSDGERKIGVISIRDSSLTDTDHEHPAVEQIVGESSFSSDGKKITDPVSREIPKNNKAYSKADNDGVVL